MTAAPTITRRTHSVLRVHGALVALVAALVVGILGMHARPAHGTAPAQATGSSVPAQERAHQAAMAAGTSHDDHTHPTAARPSGADAARPHSGTEHDMSSMVMLCIVMLAAAAMTVLLLVTGVFRRVAPAAFRSAPVRDRTPQWVRGTGPPHEWQFSVIRC